MQGIPLPRHRVTTSVDDTALFGGIDLSESLATGRVVHRKGLLTDGSIIWLLRAEAQEPGRIARLIDTCDHKTPLVVIDEGDTDDPLPFDGLLDRLAFYLDETSDAGGSIGALDIDAARDRLPSIRLQPADHRRLVEIAALSGIASTRALIFASETARAAAALAGRAEANEDDLRVAALMVFAHRAIDLPEIEEDIPPPPPEPDSEPSRTKDTEQGEIPAELVLEAARTMLSPDALEEIQTRARLSTGRGKGGARTSRLRGRPLPSRAGRADGRSRPDLLGTLHAAAPWQRLRGGGAGDLKLRQSDIRVRRFKDRSERLLIFLVDASGSAALARLAEGKGAIEILLARAYQTRETVCMGLFRDEGAELLLPPTRALARAKRTLAGLPAGGATPLGAGLKLGDEIADRARRAGQEPHIILITDGRANRALDGSGDRAQASEDAERMAKRLRAQSVPVTILDSGLRPSRSLTDLAAHLGANVISLPRSSDPSRGARVANAISTATR